MPSAPLLLADRIESKGVPARVTAVAALSPTLTRVDFELEHLPQTALQPGAHVAFRATPTQFRHFTIADIRPQTRQATVIASRSRSAKHPRGPAEQMIATWSPGARVIWSGIQVSRGLCWQPGSASLILGDATSIGIACAFSSAASREYVPFAGMIEVEPGSVAAVRDLFSSFHSGIGPDIDVRPINGEPGTALQDWIGGDGSRVVSGARVAYACGHGHSLQHVRRALIATGMPRRAVRTHPFWVPGRTGLG